ncbi:rho-related BTB domain-containing protein 1-like isoform X1 [Penaeus japonicus]|uniref:rho-related BTB domain-containing protein 1-like isoform X1 n=1 Tax=Penaeus japonicus TaxID=27405 RepID=UPI001C711C65|nr:rho-related BTB domain-containing protein 1-like isoform X1 [Penaeus japonicus]
MDNEQPHQELVKCVVVGDTAVGKTRLICARAYNKQFSLSQLLNTHVPTVFAIDQYRIYKEVLERSCVVVDGVNVSLRLWDTFGDHDKDRRFAYGRSDVVLLCFSVANPVSLRNCRVMWYPEIRRFCPNTPILLVGCKNDLRYICKDEQYLSYCRDRSPLVRPVRECDLVMPCEGRAVAREIGVEYYETSVLTYFGVNEIFDNVIRAALISRRQQRFWMTNLKRVQRPTLQVPFCPPKPKVQDPSTVGSTLREDFHCLLTSAAFTDLVLVAGGGPTAGGTIVHAHRFLVASASTAFHKLLMTDLSDCVTTRRSSDSSMLSGTFGDTNLGNFNSDTECLLGNDHSLQRPASRLREAVKRRSSMQTLPQEQHPGIHRELNHAAFQAISIEQWDDRGSERNSSDRSPRQSPAWVPVQTVVQLSKLVSNSALRIIVHFLYTGTIFCRECHLPTVELSELKQAAEFLELPELQTYVTNLMNKEEFLNNDLSQQYLQMLCGRLKELCLEGGLFSDVLFQLEDGTASVHRPLLMSRCDMMHAMFSGDFRESNAKVITFPGVKLRTFQVLLQYLYTDTIPTLKTRECLPIVELGNRLCLPRLISLVENEIIDLFQRVIQAGGDVSEDCIYLLEPLQMHNAHQLVEWCLTCMATNYNHVCNKHAKQLRSLHPENQAYLNRHRWPPVWYLKDYDYYERCLVERQREENPIKPLKRSRNTAGCLCFTSKSRRNAEKQNYRTIRAMDTLSLLRASLRRIRRWSPAS